MIIIGKFIFVFVFIFIGIYFFIKTPIVGDSKIFMSIIIFLFVMANILAAFSISMERERKKVYICPHCSQEIKAEDLIIKENL